MRLHRLLLSVVLALGCGGTSSGGAGGDGGTGEDGDGGAGGGSGSGGGDNTDLPFGECAGEEEQPPSDNSLCLEDADPEDPNDPDVFGVIEHAFVTYDGVEAVHIRITLNPTFVDNTYGENQCGWTTPGHSFGDLEESDRCEVVALNAAGDVTFDLAIDYVSPDPDSSCGYSTLGVTGGEGDVYVGDPDDVLGVQTSLSQNFNERGYCSPDDSPPAGEDCCTPHPDAPGWDFRVVYDVWLARSAFDPEGFGSAHMSYVHASPSKLGPGNNTVEVDPEPCDPGCNDPDGCDDSGGGDDCTVDDECADNEFCYEGDCLPVVE